MVWFSFFLVVRLSKLYRWSEKEEMVLNPETSKASPTNLPKKLFSFSSWVFWVFSLRRDLNGTAAAGAIKTCDKQRLGFHLRTILFSHGSHLCFSALSLHNPNISPRFMCQSSSDENNGLLQSESQVSERWINRRRLRFLCRVGERAAHRGQRISSLDWMAKRLTRFFPAYPSF